MRRTGEIEEPHTYPWSIVLRCSTGEGPVWFKAPSAACAHEVGVVRMLAAMRPDRMADVLATDAEDAWMLTRDAGAPLRSLIRPTGDIGPWRDVLPRYAELQRALSERLPALLELGTPDLRLAVLPAMYDDLLADRAAWDTAGPAGLTSAEHGRLRELAPRFRDLCEALAQHGIPESLNHGDLHDKNVFMRDDRVVFLDWGDCSVTHPFISLRTVFVSIEISLGLEEYTLTPEMAELRDLYLTSWLPFGSLDRLRAAADCAELLSPIVGASAWRRALVTADADQRAIYAHAVPELLREFLTREARMSGRS